MFIGWKVHMMTLCLLFMTFFNNEIQALQHRWKKWVDRKGGLCWKLNPKSILVSLWTFQPIFVIYTAVIVVGDIKGISMRNSTTNKETNTRQEMRLDKQIKKINDEDMQKYKGKQKINKKRMKQLRDKNYKERQSMQKEKKPSKTYWWTKVDKKKKEKRKRDRVRNKEHYRTS